jgi:hypothetical protein
MAVLRLAAPAVSDVVTPLLLGATAALAIVVNPPAHRPAAGLS